MFLGGAMAEGKEIKGAQRGIAFSTGSALAVSVLILIVGAGANSQITGGGFKILQLVPVIKEQLGEVAVVVVVVFLHLLQLLRWASSSSPSASSPRRSARC